MKAFIAGALLVSGFNAQASHFGEYTPRETHLAKMLLACSSEVGSLARQGFKSISKASFGGGMTPSGVVTDYTVVLNKEAVGNKPAQEKKLLISEMIALNGSKQYECTIE